MKAEMLASCKFKSTGCFLLFLPSVNFFASFISFSQSKSWNPIATIQVNSVHECTSENKVWQLRDTVDN